MPISRFLDYLIQSGNYETYMEKLAEAFNPAALAGLMCLNTLSVGWNGIVYDCDFNQMLDLPVVGETMQHISNFNELQLKDRKILVNQHCYGCTAGAGSSCGGEIVE
jgi:radical SAM/Cys-rich protein